MNIFNKVALESLKKSRTRTLVTIVGVVLSAAMFTAVATFGVSLLNYMTNGAAMKYGGWHVAFSGVDSAFAQNRADDRDVIGTVTFENIGYARLEGRKNTRKPYLFIAGFDKEAFAALPLTLLSGRLPENSGEVLVSGKIATEAGVKFAVGDTVSLAVGSRMNGRDKLGQDNPYNASGEELVPGAERTYTVVGICQRPAFEEDAAPGYTMITLSDSMTEADDLSLFVTLKNPRAVRSYAGRMAGGHAYSFNNEVLRFMGLSEDAGDQLIMALLYSVGAIVIVIIMIGSVFLIYNSFNISLNERTHQFGILSSVGATEKQLRSMVLFEGLCIGAVGIPAGVLAGIGGIGLVIDVVARNFGSILYTNVPLTLHVSVLSLVGAAAVSMVTILISAYIPARKAAGVPVMECILQTNEVKVEAKAVKTSKLAQRIYGVEGTLAIRNFKRNKKRYRSIVLSLVLSIVLFVSTSAFVSDLQQTSEQANEVTTYDIGFGTQDMDDGEMLLLYDRLKTADGVYEGSYQAVFEYFFTVRASELSGDDWDSAGNPSADETVTLAADLQFIDDSTYGKIIDGLGLPAGEYTGENAKIIAVARMQEKGDQTEADQSADLFAGSFVNGTLFPASGLAIGSEIGSEARAVSITCVETVPPDIPPVAGAPRQLSYFLHMMAPYSLLQSLVPSDALTDIRVKGMTFRSDKPSQSMEVIKTMIEGAGITASYLLLNSSEMLEDSRNYIFIANVFAYTFIIMISLIAVANVFNTISTNIKLRRRELAMLRSVGMSDRDFNRMLRFECAFYGMKALLFGLPIAAAASWLIYKGMFVGGAENLTFAFPWASMGISVISVLLVIFVTMMYAVSKIKKENIIDALRDDMA